VLGSVGVHHLGLEGVLQPPVPSLHHAAALGVVGRGGVLVRLDEPQPTGMR